MESRETMLAARGLTDVDDRLISADAPLADLHERCGGKVAGTLAVPELFELVRQSRLMGLRLAREFSAFDGEDQITGFVRITPLAAQEGGGCEVLVENWRRTTASTIDPDEVAARLDEIDRSTAELVARLDSEQRVQTAHGEAADLQELVARMRQRPAPGWAGLVELADVSHEQPLHWRLVDGCECKVPGSRRNWRVRLFPLGSAADPQAFELLLIADHPLAEVSDGPGEGEAEDRTSLIGDALTPALREPIARIIANAETIRTRLAGPLRQEYSDYAADISSAGQHLMSLLDDLGDLELVEAPGFQTARERIDMADAARRAAGIMSGKARDKGIAVLVPEASQQAFATGEYRRVLQILLNLLGNAISYSPAESTIALTVGRDIANRPCVSVLDQGPGLTADQQERIFKKFERLGREGDGGSGLGLYISQRLADAMGGRLEITSSQGEGARFTLILPEG